MIGTLLLLVLSIQASWGVSDNEKVMIRAFVDGYVDNHDDKTSMDMARRMSTSLVELTSSRSPMLVDASRHQFLRTRLRVEGKEDDGKGGDEYPGTEFYDPETGLMGATEKCDESNVDVFEKCVYIPAKPDTSAT